MLNFALLGCGKISERHAALLGSGAINEGRLIAVCDNDPSKAVHLAEKYSIPYYTNTKQMLEKEKIDVVNVLTPSGLHAENVLQIVKYQKHIVVEKPLALTLEDADQMIMNCDKNGVKLFVVNQNRFNLPVLKLKEAVVNNRFGKLILGTVRVRWCRKAEYYKSASWRGTWAYDGGVLTNQANHHVDLLEWIMGDVKSVFAKSSTALAEIESEDTAVVVLRFVNGALGIIEATTAVRPKDLEGSISVLGEKGAVEIGGFSANQLKTWEFEETDRNDEDIKKNFTVNPPEPNGYAHKAYLNHVTHCILNNTQSLVDGFEGRKSLELISAIYESIETGKEIFLRFEPKKCKLGHK